VEEITWQALMTVVGGSAAAIPVVQFVSLFVSLTSRAKRSVAAATGLFVVVGATVLSGSADPVTVVLAVLVGMQAGLAASKSQELVSEGLSHSVTRTSTGS